MSEELSIAKAFENRLQLNDPAFVTAYENVEFTMPDLDTPFQVVAWTFVTDNPTMGDGMFRIEAEAEVTLAYPENNGKAAAFGRAGVLRNTFKRGLNLTADGITAMVQRTPEIGKAWSKDGRYFLPITIRLSANIGG